MSDEDDAFRAIGRYVVEFSQLVREMRRQLSEFVARDVRHLHIPEMLLGEAPPQQIANAFFGMCQVAGDLDADEQKVVSMLRRQVDKIIEKRNDIAHGDWWVGMPDFSEGPRGHRAHETLPPHLVRIRPVRSEGPRKTQELSVAELDAMTDHLLSVLSLVGPLGRLALCLPIYTKSGAPVTSKGDYRVRDVLVVKDGGKRGPQARVVREGPHADALHFSRSF